MNLKTWLLIVLASAVLLCACGGHPARVDLGVDLYMHPDSASPQDVILQAAISKNLRDNEVTRRELIHVRVFELTAYLTGAVKQASSKQEAERIAAATKVTLSGGAGEPVVLQAKVENRIEVETKN